MHGVQVAPFFAYLCIDVLRDAGAHLGLCSRSSCLLEWKMGGTPGHSMDPVSLGTVLEAFGFTESIFSRG